MKSSVIANVKVEELNFAFTLDQQDKNKLIISALADKTLYQLELVKNNLIDFQEIKNVLLSKMFKVVEKTPELLQLKILFTTFQFKKIDKKGLDTLNSTIAQLSKQLKDQSQKNGLFEDLIKQLRKEFDSMTKQLTDMKKAKQEIKDQTKILMKNFQNEWEKKLQEEKRKRHQSEQKNTNLLLKIIKNEGEKLKKQLNEQRFQGTEYERVSKLHEKQIKQLKSNMILIEERVMAMNKQLQKSHKITKHLQEENNKINQKVKKDEQKQLELKRLRQLIEEHVQKLENGKLQKMKEKEDTLKQMQKQKEQQALRLIEEELKKLKLEQDKTKKAQLTQHIPTQNTQYQFSQTHKYYNIKLVNNNTKAIGQSVLSPRGLVLVEGVVFEKGSSIRFRIQSIGYGVGVGLGIRNQIRRNSSNYILENQKKIGHGCFLLLNGGKAYSHTNKEQNDVQTNFSYSKGDVIVVTRNEDELMWLNESSQWREYKMKVNLTEQEWSQVFFCAYLNYSSSSVSSVQILR